MAYRSRKQDRDQAIERRIADSYKPWSAAQHRLMWIYDSAHFPARKIQVCQVCIKAHHDIYLAQGCAVAIS